MPVKASLKTANPDVKTISGFDQNIYNDPVKKYEVVI